MTRKDNTENEYIRTGGVTGSPSISRKQTSPSDSSVKSKKPKWIVIIAAVIIAVSLLACSVLLLGLRKGNDVNVNGISGPTGTPSVSLDQYKDMEVYVHRYDGRFADHISVDGIEIGGMSSQDAVSLITDSINQRQTNWSLSLTYNGHTFITLNSASVGMNYDAEVLNTVLSEAYAIGKSGNIEDDYAAIRGLETDPYKRETVVFSNPSPLDGYLAQIADNIAQEPVNAYLSSFQPEAADPFTIIGEAYGRKLDKAGAKETILNRARNGISGNLELVPELVAPEITVSDIRRDVAHLSTWSTNISSASSDSRNSNIALAFYKINGTVLKNGDTFSFNNVVGTRTTKNGYLAAPAYAYNETVMEIGGGVCQASSTLYMAARLANLNIINRSPHSMAVNYTDFGLDATVNSTGKIIDLKFTNNTGGNIYICARIESTKNKKVCVVDIYGPAMEEGVSYKVRTEEIETIAAALMDPEIRKDTDGSHGAVFEDDIVLYKDSVDGHTVVAYLQKWQNGVMMEEHEVTRDTYPAQAAIYYIGVQKRDEFEIPVLQ